MLRKYSKNPGSAEKIRRKPVGMERHCENVKQNLGSILSILGAKHSMSPQDVFARAGMLAAHRGYHPFEVICLWSMNGENEIRSLVTGRDQAQA